MTAILTGTAVIAVGALGAALLRQPGVVLCDWIATRARQAPRPVVRAAASGERAKPASSAG